MNLQIFSSLYASICSCANTAKDCPGTINSVAEGIPPRGFYTKGTQDSVKILIVGKNPGHVLDHEKHLYLEKSPDQIVEAQLKFVQQIFETCHLPEAKKNRSLQFHRNLLRYFSYFLDVHPEDVFTHCAYTNVVKCQTVGEQDLLNQTTISTCMKKHFQNELTFFLPKIIVALGNEAYQSLIKSKLNVPVLKLKHPSYHYKKENEKVILETLKNEIYQILISHKL